MDKHLLSLAAAREERRHRAKEQRIIKNKGKKGKKERGSKKYVAGGERHITDRKGPSEVPSTLA